MFVLLISSFSISGNNEKKVCMYYFYEKSNETNFIESLKENFSFLEIISLNVNKNYGIYEEMLELYNASECLPIIFMGNEWWCLQDIKHNETACLIVIITTYSPGFNLSWVERMY